MRTNKNMYRFLGKFTLLSVLILGGILYTDLVCADETDRTVSFYHENNRQDFVFEEKAVSLNNQGLDVTNKVMPQLHSSSQTVIVRFKSNHENSLQAVVGLSSSDKGNRNNYFSIFTKNTGEVGAEIREAQSNTNYLLSRPAVLQGKEAGESRYNTVAFVADSEKSTYSLYANGRLLLEQKVAQFKPIASITGLNSAYLGGVNREGKLAFPFKGEINSLQIYDKALSRKELEMLTSEEAIRHIFKAGDATRANYFRIPTLYTLNNGRVLSSIDARYGGTHDSRSKINIATSYSDDNGITWSSPSLPLRFDDYENQSIEWPRVNGLKDKQISGSASFIDSALVQDKSTNKVFLMTDVMPAGIGNNNANRSDSGYKEINGRYYLKLKKGSDKDYYYTIRENGVVFDDRTGQATSYRVDEQYNILEGTNPLMVEQYSVRFEGNQLLEYHNGIQVKMNIFYKDSLFKVVPTNYVAYAESSDYGSSWSQFKLLPPFLGVSHNGTYLCPGQGLYIEGKGRIIFSSYTNGQMVYIMSDDHGLTWKSRTAKLPFANATAEAQMVELQPGIIRTFLRTSTGKIGYMTSRDGGDTWSAVQYLDVVKQTSYGTQVTAIKYSQRIDGKEAVILSTPNATDGRRNGQIWIGLIDERTLDIDWKYHYDVDHSKFGYSYSAITELPNHHLGLLYEKYDSWSRNELHLKDVIRYVDIDIQKIIKK